MKRLFAIVLIFVLVPYAYGETINYDNGDKYVGEVRNGKPHGQGIFSFRGGQKYFGEFKDGQPHDIS